VPLASAVRGEAQLIPAIAGAIAASQSRGTAKGDPVFGNRLRIVSLRSQ
jgi:hypothetical protein